jgi:hypothetical protein
MRRNPTSVPTLLEKFYRPYRPVRPVTLGGNSGEFINNFMQIHVTLTVHPLNFGSWDRPAGI